MKLRTLRGAVALGLATALVLTGCSADDKEATPSNSESSSTPAAEGAATAPEDTKILEGVTFSGEADKAPTDVKISSDLSKLSGPASLVSSEGTGEEIKEGDLVSVNLVTYNAKAEAQSSSYDMGAPTTLYTHAGTGMPSQWLTSVIGQKVGTRVVFGAPAQAGTESTQGSEASFMILELTATVPPRATGADQELTDDKLPKVTLDESGKPSIDIPSGLKAGDKTQVVVLKQGEGVEVKAEDYLHAQYSGWTTDGEQFDSSWERGAPTGFSLQQVIKGWTDGLSGQKVGSQVMLIIPAAEAYGAEAVEGNELSGKDLVFVVDLLAVN